MSNFIYRFFISRKISFKLVILTLLVSTFITMFITTIQLYMDYNNGMKSIKNQFGLVKSSYLASINQSIWVFDEKQINLQLAGILNLPDIEHVSINLTEGEVYKKGKLSQKNTYATSYPLLFDYKSKMITLGDIIITANLNILYGQLIDKAIVTLLSQGVKTFIVSFFILFIFQSLVTRHLETIAGYTKVLSGNVNIPPLKLEKSQTKNHPDELDELCVSINEMKNHLALSQDALKEELLIRKQTEQELQESKEDLMRAQELAKLGSWKWDIHDKYFSPSEAFQDIIGLANANEMIELDIFERLVSKEDKKYIQDFFAMIYQNYGVHQLLHSLVSLDGKEKIVRTYAEVQRDPQGNPTTIIGVTHDITTEQMVVKDNHKLLASIEQSPIFIIIINEKSIIEYINPITEKYYTYFDTPLVGKSISMFNHKENALVFNDILNIAKEENSWHGELIETDADGELHYMDTIITSIRDNNQRIVNYVIWKEDITQRKTQEKRFFEQTRQAQMGEMISMIAHQWRQPLTGISAISSLLKIKKELGTLNDEEFEQNLGDLDSLVAHLSQTITDFRDFFKPDKELERISFGEILDKSLIVLGNALHSQNITVQNTIAKETVLELYASEFIQVLLNLFKNSLDAFKSNDITSGTITLDSHQDENYFEITYSDNAGGISAEVLENIFLPYFSTKGKKNGTGLGLYMSKTIIEDHLHGRITVQSIKEQTSFTIQLPLTCIVTF